MYGISGFVLLHIQSLLDPPVHVTLHIEPWWLEPADRTPVFHQVLLSSHVFIPGLGVLGIISQRQHRFVCQQFIPQLGQEGDGRLLCLHPILRKHIIQKLNLGKQVQAGRFYFMNNMKTYIPLHILWRNCLYCGVMCLSLLWVWLGVCLSQSDRQRT